jgi:integrase
MLMETVGHSAENVKNLLKLSVRLQQEDYAGLLDRDLTRFARPPEFLPQSPGDLRDVIETQWQERRDQKFRERISQLKIAAALDQIVADKGADVAYSEAMDFGLSKKGFTDLERQAVAKQIADGYAHEAFRSGSATAGTPPASIISKIASAPNPIDLEGGLDAERDVFVNLARERAVLAADAAMQYSAAAADFDTALARLGPRLRVSRNIGGVDWPEPPAFNEMLETRNETAPDPGAQASTSSAEGQQPAAAPLSTLSTSFKPAWPLSFMSSISFGTAAARPDNDSQPSSGTASQVSGGSKPAATGEINVSCASISDEEWSRKDDDADVDENGVRLPPPKTIWELYDRQERSRRKAKKWDDKTASQVRGVVAMFVEVVGSDEIFKITQYHLGRFLDVLDALPKTHGKSSKDKKLTLNDVLTKAKGLPADSIGLGPSTINRYITQLSGVLDRGKRYGFKNLDSTRLRESREIDGRSDAEKRDMFTLRDILTLLKNATWAEVFRSVSPALYWITLIAIYTGARQAEIAGLLVGDIDLRNRCVRIRINDFRRLKNGGAVRTIPLHPELIRLGFIEFVTSLKGSGTDLVFRDLRENEKISSLADLFSNKFGPVLKEMLPNAQAEKKCFHSFRSWFNTTLINKDVNEVICETLLGHVGKTVNKKNYKKKVELSTLRRAVEKLPAVTRRLQPRAWSA